MKKLLALALCSLLVLCCGLPAAMAEPRREDFGQAYFDGLAAMERELRDKLEACEARNIPTDYEQVNYNVFRVESERFRNEIPHDWFTMEDAAYYDSCLNALYDEAMDALDALLSGGEANTYVPRFCLGPTAIAGQSVLGRARCTAGR